MTIPEPYLIEIRCENAECRKLFRPYKKKCVPPAYDIFECPYCGHKNLIIFDEQLRREVAKKELGLDRTLEAKIGEIELENKGLRFELESFLSRIDDNTKAINELRKHVDTLILQVRKEFAETIAKERIAKAKKKAPSKMYG